MAPENFSEDELKDYFNDFNDASEADIGRSMLDGIRFLRDQMHGGGEKGESHHGAVAKEQAPAIGAKLQPGAISLAKDNKKGADAKGDSVEKQIQTLRGGGTVRVKTVEEARRILDAMPELSPRRRTGRCRTRTRRWPTASRIRRELIVAT